MDIPTFAKSIRFRMLQPHEHRSVYCDHSTQWPKPFEGEADKYQDFEITNTPVAGADRGLARVLAYNLRLHRRATRYRGSALRKPARPRACGGFLDKQEIVTE